MKKEKVIKSVLLSIFAILLYFNIGLSNMSAMAPTGLWWNFMGIDTYINNTSYSQWQCTTQLANESCSSLWGWDSRKIN
jgi:hypothetical protein